MVAPNPLWLPDTIWHWYARYVLPVPKPENIRLTLTQKIFEIKYLFEIKYIYFPIWLNTKMDGGMVGKRAIRFELLTPIYYNAN